MENSQISDFGMILLFIVAGVLFVLVALFASSLLRPSRPNEEKNAPYECGEDATGTSWGQFNPRFYIIALIFILFEVEIVILMPWAVVFGNKTLNDSTDKLWGYISLVEVALFVVMLAVGLAYAWRKGFLDWVKPDNKPDKVKPVVPRELYEEVNRRYSVKKEA